MPFDERAGWWAGGRGGPGGTRPGAGQKKDETKQKQLARREQISNAVTDDIWASILARAIEEATGPDPTIRAKARDWITSYVAGKPPQDPIHIEVDQEVRIIDWSQPWSPPIIDAVNAEVKELSPPPNTGTDINPGPTPDGSDVTLDQPHQ